MCTHLSLRYEAATQALNYFARKDGGRINKLKAIKLIFFADRYHLRKFGRPITGDEYVAMEHGPVASCVKDIAELSSFLDESSSHYAKTYLSPVDKYTFKSVTDVDTDELSESDIEALNFAWGKFGQEDQYSLRDLTHAYPEWKKHELALRQFKRVRMDYIDFLSDPPAGIDPCFDLSVEDKEVVADMLKENSKIASILMG